MSDYAIPGYEGAIGPGPGQYGRPHVYARDVTSGAGNCVCGREDTHRLHVPVPASPRGGYRFPTAELSAASEENRDG